MQGSTTSIRRGAAVALALVLVVSAAAASASPAAPVAPRPTAGDFHLRGIRLGVPVDSTALSPLFQGPVPTFIDSHGNHELWAVELFALGDENGTGPEGTSLFALLGDMPDRRAWRTAPITVLAWLGGSWLNHESDFPLHVGEPAARATDVLGPALASFEIEASSAWRWGYPGGKKRPLSPKEVRDLARGPNRLKVTRHAGDIYALADGAKLVGFVLGPMPPVRSDRLWSHLVEIYAFYTVEHRYPTGQ